MASHVGAVAPDAPGSSPPTAARRGHLLAVNHTGLVSGGEKVLLRLLTAAHERGWETTVAAPEGPIVDCAAEVGSTWLPIPDLMLPGGRAPVAATLFGARNVIAAQRIRAAPDADVVVATGMRVLPTVRLARPRAPVIWLAQSMIDRRRWMLLVRACGRGVDTAVAVSHAVAASIGPTRFPVRVVRNGTPWPVAPAPADPPSPPVVGCAAMLTPWKGQHVLLDAVARLDRDDVCVELMGGQYPKDGAYVASLRRRANQPDLAGRVRFLGHVDDPIDRMRGWTLAVVSSVDPEAGPLAAIEAMSVGVPVVATDHGGPRELVGDAGVLVPPGDSVATAAAIGSFLEDGRLRSRCAQAGPRIVESQFRLDRQIDALLHVVEDTVDASVR